MAQLEAEAVAEGITIPKGLDYAWPPHPPIVAMKAAGITFVVRYLSLDPAKNLSAPERDALLGAGIRIALVWETTARRMLSGRDAGKTDALKADAQAFALHMAGIPVYFACDFDATPADQILINAYLDGVADSIGRGRTGIYGGYWPLSRALDAGKAKWAWQTYAWSGGRWDDRAQLRQVLNGIKIGGVAVDLDEAHAPDFGQWPRPVTTPPPPIPDWELEIMNRLPLVRYGDNDRTTGHRWVRRVQGALIVAYGQDLGPAGGDGIYGQKTRDAVKRVLADHGVTGDGRQVDRHGWAVLITGADL